MDDHPFDELLIQALTNFWAIRKFSRRGRSSKCLDGFFELAKAAAPNNVETHTSGKALTLPGYYRPKKTWDVVFTKDGLLIGAIELKSQARSFAKNFNNRAEEAIGSATDFWAARKPKQPKPFLGYLMLLADCPKSKPTAAKYEKMCERMMSKGLYTNAALVLAKPNQTQSRSLSEATDVRTFFDQVAEHLGSA